jgi:hypothetical protein
MDFSGSLTISIFYENFQLWWCWHNKKKVFFALSDASIWVFEKCCSTNFAQTIERYKWAVLEIKPFFQIAAVSKLFFLGFRKVFQHLSYFKTVKFIFEFVFEFIFYAVLKAFFHGMHYLKILVTVVYSASSCLMGWMTMYIKFCRKYK